MSRNRRKAFVAALAGVLVLLSTLPLTSPAVPRAAAETRPNVVLIVSDDQRWDTLWAMPAVRELLGASGVTFENAFVPNPVCCPSRASILTGTYSHTNGVWTNRNGAYGGFEAFDETSTLATWLQDAGYRTGLMGKYLNGYHRPGRQELYVPEGWDRWWSFVGGRYYGFSVNSDGAIVSYGEEETDYVTDVMAAEAEAFIRAEQPDPFFLYLTPKAPHLPSTPAARHASLFQDLEPWRPASWNEADMSDKPTFLRKRPELSIEQIAALDHKRLEMLRSLVALDEMVARVVTALEETGQLRDTMIIFTSDNGYAWGEHRWDRKTLAYEEVIRVPMVIRFDRLIGAPLVDANLALNIDLAPTIAEVTGLSPPPMDGASLVPLLTETTPVEWRQDFLVEHWGGKIPPYCGVRTTGHLYVAYADGQEELYRLAKDPDQLDNLATDPTEASLRDRLRSRLVSLCSSPPPGMDPIGL